MLLFEADDNSIINLEMIGSVTFGKIKGERSVICYIAGQAYVIPEKKHKEFFMKLTALSKELHKQFSAL